MCFDFVYNFETFLILKRTEWVMIKNFIGLHVKYQLFLSNFNETILLVEFWKNTQIWNFMKIWPMGANFFCADGQTDMAKLTDACCCNFENVLKKYNVSKSITMLGGEGGTGWSKLISIHTAASDQTLKSSILKHSKRIRCQVLGKWVGSGVLGDMIKMHEII